MKALVTLSSVGSWIYSASPVTDEPIDTEETVPAKEEQPAPGAAPPGSAGEAATDSSEDSPAATTDDGPPIEPQDLAEAQEAASPLELARAETARLKDQLLRTAADFDNYRKRSRKDLVDAEARGRKGTIDALLPVFDNLERATSHARAATDVQSLANGISMVLRQFQDALGRMGIERIESVGKPFDPTVHEAIQHLETSEYPPGSVAAEVQAGYREGDRLIRAATVVVAKPPASPPSPAPDEN